MSRLLVLVAIALATSVAVASAAVSGGGLRTAERFVAHRCHRGSLRSTNMWQSDPTFHFNALYGDCGGGDGHEQRIWFFDGTRFVGTDTRTSSAAIVGLWRNLNTIAVMYVLYRPDDALCCATGGGTVVRYHWTGKHVERLDSLPRRTATAHSPGRYP